MKKMPSGYGMILNSVMRNDKLSIEAKAIYSLLCSYTGSKKYCFPKVSTIIKDLNISNKRFYKYMDELLEIGYVVKGKLFDDMRNNNKYEIMYPDEDDHSSQNDYIACAQNDTVDSSQNDTVINSNSINNINNNSIEAEESAKEFRREMKSMFNKGASDLQQIITWSVGENSTLKELYNRLKKIDTDLTLEELTTKFMAKFFKNIKYGNKDYWNKILFKPNMAIKRFDEIMTELNKESIQEKEVKNFDIEGIF